MDDEEYTKARAAIEQEVMARIYAEGVSATLGSLFDRIAKLEVTADLAIRGFRRWKRNTNRKGGSRHEAEHGLTDLGQGIWELAELIGKNKED